MAENSTNAQERDPDPQTDKENRPNPLGQIQPKTAKNSKKRPLQESRSTNLPESTKKKSSPFDGERRNDLHKYYGSVQKTAHGRIEAPGSALIGTDGNQSELVQATDIPPSSSQQSIFESRATSQELRALTYEWKGKERKVKANPNKTILDIMKQNNGIKINKKNYLIVSAGGSGAVINPWVPCGALTRAEKLILTIKNIKPPKPSTYSKYSDLKCFIVKTTVQTYRKVLHNPKYCDNNKPLLVYGYKEESIREALERDTRFDVTSGVIYNGQTCDAYLSVYSKNLSAELYTSVPCGALEDGEELTVSIRKGKSPETYRYPKYTDGMFIKFVDFKNMKSKLHEKHYYNKKPLAVYGNKDQTVREALNDDKRFNISAEFVLYHAAGPECSSQEPLSKLKDKEHIYVIYEEKRSKEGKKNPEVQGSQTTDDTDGSLDSPKLSTKMPEHYKECTALHVVNSTKFSNAFNELPHDEKITTLRNTVADYKRYVLYKKAITAKLHDTLNKHKEYVAIIGYKSGDTYQGMGTVFFLNNTLALTCKHVIKAIEKFSNAKDFYIIFNYDEEPLIHEPYSVKAIVLYEPEPLVHTVRTDIDQDFAFLTIKDEESPFKEPEAGLYKYVIPSPTKGHVGIIGHPTGKCKKVDAMCCVIEYTDPELANTRNILFGGPFVHLFTTSTFSIINDNKYISYDSCMYEGSSGAPVFNDEGKLIAMHSGGYKAEIEKEKPKLIEFGRHITDIIDYGIRHCDKIRQHLGYPGNQSIQDDCEEMDTSDPDLQTIESLNQQEGTGNHLSQDDCDKMDM